MKKNNLFKRISVVILAATLAFTSVPVNAYAEEVTEVNVENIAAETEAEEAEKSVSANDLNSDLDSSLNTEDNFFGFKLNPMSKDEISRQIEELKENSSVPVIDLSEAGENDIEADQNFFTDVNDPAKINYNVSYPSKYDPRSLGLVTPVKNQGQWGLCWNYSAISTAESSLIKTGLADSSIDLSELHAAYAAYKHNQTTSPNKISFTYFCNKGGNSTVAFSPMSCGFGPVSESVIPWQEPTNDFTLSDDVLNTHLYELQTLYSVKYNADQESINKVKWLVSNLGAADIGLYMYYADGWGFKDAANNTADASFYFPKKINDTNHALSVVGWDDDYPATNFGVTAPGNGAWLVKNSYGTGGRWGSGYIWVSYYDGSMNDDYIVSPSFVSNGTLISSLEASVDKEEIYAGDAITLTVKKTPANSPYGFTVTGDTGYYDHTKLSPVSEENGVYTYQLKTETEYSENGFSYKPYFEMISDENSTYGGVSNWQRITYTVKYLPIIKTNVKNDILDLEMGETYTITPSLAGNVPDDFTESYSYASSDTAVATVNNRGRITVKGIGTATITITDKNGFAKEASLTVNGLYNYKYIDVTTDPQISLTLNKGEVKAYTPSICLENDDGDQIDITNDKNTSIRLTKGNEYGYVKDGKLYIDTTKSTAETKNDNVASSSYEFEISYNGKYTNNKKIATTVKVNLKTVYPVISLPQAEVTLNKGETYQIEASLLKGAFADGNGFVYELDWTYAADVSETGLITANESTDSGFVIVTVSDKMGYAEPVNVRVTVKYGYTDFTTNYGDKIEIHLTGDKVWESIENIYPVFKGGEEGYPADYTTSTNDSAGHLTASVNRLTFNGYKGMPNELNYILTITYTGQYADGNTITKQIPVTVIADESVRSALNKEWNVDPDPSYPTYDPSYGQNANTGVDGSASYNPSNSNNKSNVTAPKPTAKPVSVKATSCSAKNNKGKLKITWKKKSGITGYQIQYSTSKKFTGAKTKTIKNAKTTSKTYKAIRKGKKHYVRVRCYKVVNGKKYYSAWSRVKSVKVK